jgi:hypothetical protein
MFGDPHYQSRSVVERFAQAAGFRSRSVRGGWWLYTADFIKPHDLIIVEPASQPLSSS